MQYIGLGIISLIIYIAAILILNKIKKENGEIMMLIVMIIIISITFGKKRIY